ncbi:hypothetical protein B7486_16505 [cyanobacterium TDX16]|nr:hypothetical protein B7486_16505 [cyanobacterium TDX16]
MNPSEAVAIGEAIEKVARKEAKERHAEGTNKGRENRKNPSRKSLPRPKGQDETKRTSTVAASASGMSRTTYEKAKAIAEAATEDPGRFTHPSSRFPSPGIVP